jgi:GMP synthase-like glutamine amidotransferase
LFDQVINLKKKIAIIHCNDPKEKNFVTKSGRRAEVWKLTARAIEKKGMESKTYFPILDKNDFPAVDDQDAIIIPGSVFTPKREFVEKTEWMQELLEFIREVVDAKVPLFGMCFGHQAIGAAYGIYPIDLDDKIIAEAAFHKLRLTDSGVQDPLFVGIPRKFNACEFHYSYLPRLPPNSIHLAQGDNVFIQAFRMNEHVWGVQFHPDYGLTNALQVIARYKSTWPKEFQGRELNLQCSDKDNLAVLNNFLDFVKRIRS